MGNIFTLSPGVIQTMNLAISDLIFYLGKQCKIVYPPKITPCVNCLKDSVGNKSKNIYLHGGPFPFPQGSICPMCDGAGSTQATETFDIVQFIVNWNPKVYQNIKLDNTRLSNGVIHIKGYIVDMPKIQRMNYLIPHIDIEAYAHYRFRLSSEPIAPGNIVQGQYFSCLLDRIQ